MKINYLEESAMERKTQPARTVDAATSSLDGAVVNVTEIHRTSDPVMYPDLLGVELKRTTPATISLPKAWRALLCVECDGARRPGSADPLDLDHDERCVLGAEDRAQVERDLAVIRREMARGGRSWRARVATGVERMLLSEYGVVPPSHCTTIHLDEDGRWWRSWRWLDEPALAVS